MQVDVQFVDWGALIGMLGLLVSVVVPAVGLLWRAIATQMKSLNGRLDKQDQDMAELKSDMAVVQNDLGHVKDDLGHLRNDFRRLESRCDLMDTNIVQIMRDVGRLQGGQRSAPPKEKVGAGGS